MKRIANTIFAALIIFSCTLKASAQSEVTRQVSGFNKLSTSGPFTVHVKIDGTESLKISASAEALNNIETEVEDGTLKVKVKYNTHWIKKDYGAIDVYITAKSLSSVTNAGSGEMNIDGSLTGDKVSVVLSGSGSVKTVIKSSDLKVVLSGSGSMHLSGHSSDAAISISGSGEVKAKELTTSTVSAIITGSGNIYISADKTITAHLIGSGNVMYSGNATVDSKVIGSGRVSKSE